MIKIYNLNNCLRYYPDPLLDSDRPRRGVSPSPLPLVSEGSSLIVTTPKPRTTTVEIVWATNWWDVFLSRYKWGEDDHLFGAETGSTLSRVPGNCEFNVYA